MTDLTGAELDFEVARVMGLRAVIALWPPPCPPPDKYASKRSPACFLPDEGGRMFRPSRGGAAAWEVLEWVWQQGWDVSLRCVELCLDSDEPVTESALCTLRATRPVRECQATGPTDAIALCRAVVALGEAG